MQDEETRRHVLMIKEVVEEAEEKDDKALCRVYRVDRVLQDTSNNPTSARTK